MAYDKFGLQINRGTTTANGQGSGTSVIHTYFSSVDDLATILSGDYFPDFFVELDSVSPNIPPQTIGENVLVNDYLFILGTDLATIAVIIDLQPVALSTTILVPNSISVGTPIVATDNNGLVYEGGVLQTEFADATHNGIVSTINQTFAGEKFFDNLITTAGITDSVGITTPQISINNPGHPINFFQSDPIGFTWSGPWGASTIGGNVTCTIINDTVMISIQNIVPMTGSVSSIIVGSPAIPSVYWPTAATTGTLAVLNNGTYNIGIAAVGATGMITIYQDPGGDPFNGPGLVGFQSAFLIYNKLV